MSTLVGKHTYVINACHVSVSLCCDSSMFTEVNMYIFTTHANMNHYQNCLSQLLLAVDCLQLFEDTFQAESQDSEFIPTSPTEDEPFEFIQESEQDLADVVPNYDMNGPNCDILPRIRRQPHDSDFTTFYDVDEQTYQQAYHYLLWFDDNATNNPEYERLYIPSVHELAMIKLHNPSASVSNRMIKNIKQDIRNKINVIQQITQELLRLEDLREMY